MKYFHLTLIIFLIKLSFKKFPTKPPFPLIDRKKDS